MALKMKSVLLVVVGIVVLLVSCVVAVVLFLDVNAHKPRVEAAASDALEMEVKIRGKMGLSLFPAVGVTLRDVEIRNRGTDIARAAEVRAEVELLPLIRREIVVSGITLAAPRVRIEREPSGSYNYETPKKKVPGSDGKKARSAPVRVERIRVSNGEIDYMDRKSGDRAEARGLDLTVRPLSFGGGDEGSFAKTLAFAGEARCKSITAKEFEISDLSVKARAGNGVFTLEPVTMKLFGGSGEGSAKIDVAGPVPLVHLRYAVSKFRFEESLRAFRQKRALTGEMNVTSNLAMRGKSPDELRRTMGGDVSLKGENLVTHGLDLDELLDRYEKSQSFQLVDVGAFLLAGPIGTGIAKGYGFASIYEGARGGDGRIRNLVSDWKVRDGVAEAKDVAFTTRKNRIALKGKLDFVRDRFDGVTVAVLDEKGCAKVKQGISGPFANPKVDKVSFLKSVAGPVFSLFEKATKWARGGECEAFYSGSLAHPKQ